MGGGIVWYGEMNEMARRRQSGRPVIMLATSTGFITASERAVCQNPYEDASL
jgi:hypothetical protein